MERTAQRLRRKSRPRKPLPAILAFTDPMRTPDLAAFAEALPKGCAIVYRSFGAPDALEQAIRLRTIARRRGLLLLIGADAQLARAARADGVHLPERLAARARRLKVANPGWIVTAAAHALPAIRRARHADAVVVSAVFPSASPSAGKPIGPRRLARLVASTRTPVYALGGVDMKNARKLAASGVVGIAAVSGLART